MTARARGVLELDYTQYSVGPVNTTIGWTYRDLTCQPAVFVVEGYEDKDAILADEPMLTLNSTSTMVLLPNINNVPLYLRLLAYDETGANCAQGSEVIYYQLDRNGRFLLSCLAAIPKLNDQNLTVCT